MASIETQVTLDEVTAAIVATLATVFDEAVQTVAAYPDQRTKIATPAILIECVEMAPAEDPGTEQTALRCRFEAHCLVSGYESGAKAAVRTLAAQVSHAVRQSRWGLPVGSADLLGARPDDYFPELEETEVWIVEWEQTIHVGSESIWSPPEDWVEPGEVWVGITPDIGLPHVDDYVKVTDD